MDISDEDMTAVGEAAHAVIREAKDAGVYVFGGSINEDVAPLMIAADGTRHKRDLSADQGVQRRLLCPGTPVARSRHPMGRKDCQSLPLLAGTPRVRVRLRELTGEVAARCERGGGATPPKGCGSAPRYEDLLQ
jgi:hypothetical protein